MIQTVELTKRFGEISAVENLSISVEPGEVFGFLGPNGAGKTTTLRMLAALISPTHGSALVAGHRLDSEADEIRRSVGILTESPGLYDRLSAERNLSYFATLYEVEDVAGQVERYLRMLGLWERRRDEAGTFSRGMRQKLAIARALLHEPKVVFLDEPTSGLDPEAARLIREFISELREQGRTIFMCTHNLDEADRLCDRIAIFNNRLLALDTPEALRRELFDHKVVFHLRATGGDFAQIVMKLPYVHAIERIENKLVVTLDDPVEHNPEIVRALVDAGADIQFVGEVRRTLEDVYLHTVREPANK
jgi:ABC-2 type transport system ATP-binding protein